MTFWGSITYYITVKLFKYNLVYPPWIFDTIHTHLIENVGTLYSSPWNVSISVIMWHHIHVKSADYCVCFLNYTPSFITFNFQYLVIYKYHGRLTDYRNYWAEKATGRRTSNATISEDSKKSQTQGLGISDKESEMQLRQNEAESNWTKRSWYVC
jgi:hypothetical protein